MIHPILIIGSVNMDLVMQVAHCPAGGETALGTQYGYVPGGKGGNTAVAAARLGLPVAFTGCVGQDDNGTALRTALERDGVNTTHLRTVPQPTGLAAIVVEGNGQNRIIVYAGANHSITAVQLETVFQQPWSAVMMQLEIPPAIVLEANRMAEAAGIPVVLDAGPVRAGMDVTQQCGAIWILSPNETETLALTGIQVTGAESAERAACALLQTHNARHVVLKLGGMGAYHYHAALGAGQLVPGFAVTPVDTTAAGDAFTAALTVSALERQPETMADWQACVRFANAVGALAVTVAGAQPSLPVRAVVEAFVRERAT